jgi:hypothetical protein
MRTNVIWSGLQITIMQDILKWMTDNCILGTSTVSILIQEYPDNIPSMRWGACIVF